MGDMMNWPSVDETPVSPAHSGADGLALSDFDLAAAVRSDACVLLTGKKDAVESAAYLIHSLSGWRRGPFTVVDCGWPEAVVESMVFGPAPDAEPPVPAEPYPRMAQAGTILLRDVGRLGPAMQSKLADLPLHLREPRRPRQPRRRLMASTSEPLLPRVLDGTFNDRLFYRLNVIHLRVPEQRRGCRKRRT